MASASSLRKPGLIVYLCGLGTSLLTLWIVIMINDHGENIMGWYANGIIPAGALLVGIASGTGYAMGSRWLQVKLSRGFVLGMIGTGLLDYAAAQYQWYTHDLERYHISEDRVSFFDYFQRETESMAFKSQGSNKPGDPMGKAGYFFKFLEMVGYVGGCMLPSTLVFGMPYCRRCQLYLKKDHVGYLNSAQSWAAAKKLKKEERAEALRVSNQDVQQRANAFCQTVGQASLADTQAAIERLDPAPNKDSAARVTVTLKKCPKCEAHHLNLFLQTFVVNKKPAHAALAKIDKTGGIIA